MRKYNCFYCGVEMIPNPADTRATVSATRTRDHLHPQSRGACTSSLNIAYACFRCNQKKGGLTVEEYRAERQRQLRRAVEFFGEKHPENVRVYGATPIFHKLKVREAIIQYLAEFLPQRPAAVRV